MVRRFCFEINMVASWFGIEESQTTGYPWRVSSFAYRICERKRAALVTSTHCTKPIQGTSTTSIPMACPNAIEHRLQQRLGLQNEVLTTYGSKRRR